MSLSHTARLTYVLLLDRMTLSQKNSWVDAQGRAYVLYPLAGLAADLQSSISSVTRALRELEAARLIERRSNGFSKPNQIFLGVPQTVQKCAIEMVKNEQPDCSKVSNTIAQNCTPNQINKNNLRLNKINRTKEAYGRYQNVFLENYSELKIEIAELDALIEDLSAYMQSTGKKVRRPRGDPAQLVSTEEKTTETGNRHPGLHLQRGGKFMTETIRTAMDRLMTTAVEPQDYVAEDGLLYCGSCNTPKGSVLPERKKAVWA